MVTRGAVSIVASGAALSGVLATTGCASVSATSSVRSAADLRALLAPRIPELSPEDIVIPHEISNRHLEAAREFLSRNVGPKSRVEDRVRALLTMLSSPAGLGLKYEWAATADANTTIETGGGSCLSLSAVLIAFARGLGIRAHYVDASSAASETQKDGELTVHSGHIAVVLKYRHADALVDFAGEIDRTYKTRRVDDLDIVAHYYNNRGYELIHEAQKDGEDVPWRDVLGRFRIATKVSPDFALAWNNVGLALQRLGRKDEALLAFRHALALDASLVAARRNLSAWSGEKPAVPIGKRGVKWVMAAGGPAAITWRIAALPELSLETEVPEPTVEADR